VRITKESKSSERRIDLAVAMVMGLERAMTLVEEPAAPAVNFF
jgi:phage terminase large subunit-like protein